MFLYWKEVEDVLQKNCQPTHPTSLNLRFRYFCMRFFFIHIALNSKMWTLNFLLWFSCLLIWFWNYATELQRTSTLIWFWNCATELQRTGTLIWFWNYATELQRTRTLMWWGDLCIDFDLPLIVLLLISFQHLKNLLAASCGLAY